MGQNISRLCVSGPNSRGGAGLEGRGWKRLQADSVGDLAGKSYPDPGDVAFIQPPQSPAVSSVSMLANYDDDDRELEALTEESSWETVQLEDDDKDNEEKGGTSSFKYSSAKSQTGKRSTGCKKRKRSSKGAPASRGPTTIASTSGQMQTTAAQPHCNNLAGSGFSKNGSTFRPGNLPSVITDSKPMKDADRLLGVLSEHADGCLEEGPESGDAVRRIIQHDIGRERTVNTRLRELKDIDGRKSERRLSVTAAATMSLHVIPEIVGEEPTDPSDFEYSDTNFYF